jgi:predicted Zn-dependent peptidase
LETIRQIHHEVTRNGITADELAQAKSKIAARLVLSAERPRSRLFPVGYNWMYRQEYRTVEEDLAELDRVTLAGVEQLLRAFPLDDMTTVCLGPLTSLGNLDSLTAASFNSRAARLNRV